MKMAFRYVLTQRDPAAPPSIRQQDSGREQHYLRWACCRLNARVFSVHSNYSHKSTNSYIFSWLLAEKLRLRCDSWMLDQMKSQLNESCLSLVIPVKIDKGPSS